MASTTSNLGLTKPANGEAYSIDVFNQNFQKIDDNFPIVQTGISLTIINSKITSAERKFAIKFGKVVVVDLSFTVGTAITGSTEALFSGLPVPASGFRFRLFNTLNNNTPIRLSVQNVSSEGRILNAYSTGGIPAGVYEGQFVYICA